MRQKRPYRCVKIDKSRIDLSTCVYVYFDAPVSFEYTSAFTKETVANLQTQVSFDTSIRLF